MSQRYVAFYGADASGALAPPGKAKMGTFLIRADHPVSAWSSAIHGGNGIYPWWNDLLKAHINLGWTFFSWRYVNDPTVVARESDWTMRERCGVSLIEGRFVGTDLESAVALFDQNLTAHGYTAISVWARGVFEAYGSVNEQPEEEVPVTFVKRVSRKPPKPDLAQEWFAKTMLDPEASADLAKRAMEAVRAMSSGG